MFDVIEEVSQLKDHHFWPTDAAIAPFKAATYGNTTVNAYSYFHTKLKELKSTTYADRLLRPGRLLALYKEITNNTSLTHYFIGMLKVIGNWDAYCALAEYIAAHKDNHEKPVSFADRSVVQIDLKNSWAPVFTGSKPVLNTISLGGQAPRNMLLVAPNSSGKSSIMKTAMINAITFQVGGFVAAQQGSQMPIFVTLGSYMNIKEDPKAGLSTGAAQAAGLQELKDMIHLAALCQS